MDKSNAYWASQRNDGYWTVNKSGYKNAASVHKSQADAWKETRRLARGAGTVAYLEGKNGRIKTCNSYEDESSLLSR